MVLITMVIMHNFGTANYFTAEDFNERTVQAGDNLILIDKNTFART